MMKSLSISKTIDDETFDPVAQPGDLGTLPPPEKNNKQQRKIKRKKKKKKKKEINDFYATNAI